MNTEEKILLVIYAAQQNPQISTPKVRREIKEKLGLDERDLITMLTRLEDGRMIIKGRSGYVLSPEGRQHIDKYEKRFLDKLHDAAKTGEIINVFTAIIEFAKSFS